LHRTLRLIVTELNAGLSKFTDDGPGLGGGDTRALERFPQLGQGEMALAAAALDQLVHMGHGGLIVVRLRRGGRGPRHETPPPFVAAHHRTRCFCTTVLLIRGGAVVSGGPQHLVLCSAGTMY